MKNLLLILFIAFSNPLFSQGNNASITIEGETQERINKYTKTFKVRKKYETNSLGNVSTSIKLGSKVINNNESDNNGVYKLDFNVEPNYDYVVSFEKKGFFPKVFSFNTNGISNHKKIIFENWDFYLFKRIIGLPDSIFLIPTKFYYDSERGYMTYDEKFNISLEVAQDEKYLDFIRNLNEVEYKLDTESNKISTNDNENIENTTSINDSNIKPTEMPIIKLFDLQELMTNLEVSEVSNSLIEDKKDEISNEWQQLEIAKTKAVTVEDKENIEKAEKLLIEKEDQIKLAKAEIEKAEKQIKLHKLENKNKNTLLLLSLSILGLFIVLILVLFKNNKERENNNLLLAHKNKEVIDSILYAQRLQNAILPPENVISKNLNESFILYQPKDIVSGDFYWVENLGDTTLFAVVDCTGHGVPGAFMSIIAYNALNQAINQHDLTKPSDILNQVNIDISKTLHQAVNIDVEDGMDISLCSLNTKTDELQYAGAHHSLNLFQNGELKTIKGDKFSIGSLRAKNKKYSNHNFKLEKGDYIYTFSDGFADQFGGEKGRKYMYKRLRNFLVQNSNQDAKNQSGLLIKEFNTWKGDLEQVDDVCVMGVKIV